MRNQREDTADYIMQLIGREFNIFNKKYETFTFKKSVRIMHLTRFF